MNSQASAPCHDPACRSRRRHHRVFLGPLTLLASASLAWAAPAERLVLHDPLTSPTSGSGVAQKRARGGEYGAQGWRATQQGDFLMVELADAGGFEGALEIQLRDLDWVAANTAGNRDKIQFLGMFSNPRAELHVEGGGTNLDALWSLRGGTAPDGSPAYGNRFAVLQSSRGAKRAEPSDFVESVAPMVSGWKWDKRDYTFRVTWSKARGELCGYVDGQQMFHEPWVNQVSPLRYIYIAKGPDFATFIGPRFHDLRVYRTELSQVTNQTPTVSLVRPRNGSVASAGASVELEAEVTDDGVVRAVEFFLGERKIGQVSQPPYVFLAQGIPDGWYQVSARATDDRDAAGASNPKFITVGQPWQPWGLTQPAR